MSLHIPNYDHWLEENELSPQSPANQKHIWSIILAGGNGDRMSGLIRSWMGRAVPKQYCAFTGTRSMLQHTLRRTEKLASPDHQLIVVAESHQHEAKAQLAGQWSNNVIVQPENRDTLPGIFLPLTHVYARDSKAIVAIYPSDHFIYPEDKFGKLMEHAIQAAEEMPDRIMLVGARAAFLELDYGWICPGRQILKWGHYPVRSVDSFVEKPSSIDAAEAMARGGMWNTMIMAGKVRTLWQLGCTYFPEVMKHFEQLLPVIGTSHEQDVLKAIYEVMPKRNFSSGLLTQAISQIGVIPMKDVFWCDWGREERILETLHKLGKQPNFPLSLTTSDQPSKINSETLHLPSNEAAAAWMA